MDTKRWTWGALVATSMYACTTPSPEALDRALEEATTDAGAGDTEGSIDGALGATTPLATWTHAKEEESARDVVAHEGTEDAPHARELDAMDWDREPEPDPIDALLSFGDVDRALASGLPDPRGLPMHRVGLHRIDPRTGEARIVLASAFVLPEGDRAITLEGIVEPLASLGEARDPRVELTRIERAWHDSPFAEDREPGALTVLWLDQALVGDPWRARADESFRTAADLRFIASIDRALEALALHDDVAAIEHGRVARALLEGGLDDPSLVAYAFRASWFDLLLDLERRERERDTASATPSLDMAAARVDLDTVSLATLLDSLDELDGPPSSVSSRTVILRHPIARAIVARGRDAIEPLLCVFVDDTRVTRIVRSPDSAVTVSYAALNLVHAIADLAPAEPGLPIGELVDDLYAKRASLEEVAARVRAFLARGEGLAPEERWYLALRDGHDPAGAAWMISQPRELARRFSATRPWWSDETIEPKAEGLAGEPLRDGRTPSVSDLLAARVVRHRHRADCVALARLTRWDPPRATLVRARLSRRYRARDRCE